MNSAVQVAFGNGENIPIDLQNDNRMTVVRCSDNIAYPDFREIEMVSARQAAESLVAELRRKCRATSTRKPDIWDKIVGDIFRIVIKRLPLGINSLH